MPNNLAAHHARSQGFSLLASLPGETLFSLCARQHRMWGYSSAASTCKVLFGSPRSGVHHDLPNALGRFERLTHGRLGDAFALARNHTILSFYAPFISSEELDSVAQTMAGPTVAHLKFRLGLLTSGFRANHPLKTCDECMAADVEDFGWTYWHLIHQYPGVWTCPWHGQVLRESRLKANGVQRFMWHLPKQDQLLKPQDVRPEALEARQKLTDLIVGLAQAPRQAGWLSATTTRTTIRRRLSERGWLTQQGNLRTASAAKSFQTYLERLGSLPDLSNMPMDERMAQSWIGRLARPPRTGTHPLRWLLAIDWLFDGVQDFVDAHDSASSVGTSLAEEAKLTSTTSPPQGKHDVKARVIEALFDGRSASAVSAEFDISVGTAMAWGAAAGIEPRRRPKTMLATTREAIASALRAGDSKPQVASALGVSVQAVTRMLQTQPGLRTAWKTVVQSKSQTEHRTMWIGLLKTHPGVGTKLLRAMCPASYAWLYRNDREWLQAHGQPLAKRQPRRSSIRWDERDRALCDAVQAAVCQLAGEGRTARLKLSDIVPLIPELRAKMGSIRRLPLTARALEQVLGRSMSKHLPDLLA